MCVVVKNACGRTKVGTTTIARTEDKGIAIMSKAYLLTSE